ncbi:MAG TPA: AfsR/SARP family transcriptional regulator [Micromonosporaceae bacterium]
MRVDILGPLSAEVAGTSIVPSAAKPCQILALLALSNENLVTNSALFDELWENDPPRSATTTLHTYIHQLRRKIDRALAGRGSALTSRDILVTERGGYSLRLHGGTTDVRQFQLLAQKGTAAFECGDFRTAAALLRDALALWRGPVLSDIHAGQRLTLHALSLEDARLAALDRRIEADLRLGRHQEIVGELRALCHQNPINENFAAHYMVALYHSGRVAMALQEFQRLRSTLVTELGVEPAPRLRRLQRVILSGGQPLDDRVLAKTA